MFRMIGSELKKYCYLPYMLIVLLGVICLGFAGTVYDPSGMPMTIAQLMIQYFSGEELMSISYSGVIIWSSSLSSWLSVFLPLILTLSYISVLSDERQNGLVQFELIRSGNLRYCVSKVLSGAFYGGLAFLISYAILGGIFMVVFPSISAFPVEEQAIFLRTSLSLYLLKRLVGSFFYGVFASMFGIGVSIFFRDKYMLLCLPFLLNYIYEQMLMKMVMKLGMTNMELSEWLNWFYPSQIANVSMNRYWITVVLLVMGVYIGLVVLFYQKVKRGKWIG